MKPKILCLCSASNNRSVATGYLLKDHYRYDAVCAGAHANTPDTLKMLADWADCILVCGESDLARMLPGDYSKKLVQLNVGPDRWGPTYHHELLALVKSELQRIKLL